MSARPPRPAHTRMRALAVALCLTVLATGCATTATRDVAIDGAAIDDAGGFALGGQDGQDGGAVNDAGDPGAAGVDDGTQPFDPGSAGDAGSLGGSAGGSGGGSGGRSASAGGNRAKPAPDGLKMGRGVTASEIRIGFEVSEGLNEVLGAMGYNTGGDVPNEAQIVGALVNWLNKRGGIRGRKVVPILHPTNPTSGNFATQAQAACSTFTEDNHVFAAGSAPAAGSEILAACMAEKRTPFLAHNYWPFGTEHFRKWAGYFYQPGRAGGERHWAASIDALAGAGFFKGAKVGLVSFDAPQFRHLTDDVVKPRLARHGIKPAAEAAVSTIYQASDVSKVSAESNSIILRFRAAGVTHVMFVEYQGTIPFFFLPQAESQNYRPAYGLVSSNNPSTVAKQSPAAQLEHVMGVGWNPGGDTLRQNYHPNATAALCEQAMKEGGYAVNYAAAGFYIYPQCDTLLFVKAALERAPELTTAGLQAGIAALGDSYLSPQGMLTRFGPGRADGSDAYRLFRFDAACACFAYTGPVRRFP